MGGWSEHNELSLHGKSLEWHGALAGSYNAKKSVQWLFEVHERNSHERHALCQLEWLSRAAKESDNHAGDFDAGPLI